MNGDKLRSYRFKTQAQWNACLFVQTDRGSLQKEEGVRPFAPYARPGKLYESRGAHAPVVTRAGEVLWRDDDGAIRRLTGCDDAPEICAAPSAFARATRIVATSSGLWVIVGGQPQSLQRYEEDTLTRLLTVEFHDAQIADIAGGDHGSVLALVEREGLWQSIHVDQRGHEVKTITFQGISHAEAFVFLRRSQKFVVLAGKPHPRLHWFSAEGGRALHSLAVEGMRPCFKSHALGSDSRDKVFLAGADGDEFGGGAYVVMFDADGESLGELPLDPLDAPATGIAATRDRLLITGRRGLLQFHFAESVPEGAGLTQCQLLTPLLFSPDREDGRRWLRVEATASLPEGSTLEILWAATDVPHDRPNGITMDDAIPASQQVAKLLNDPELRRGRTVFKGAAGSEASVAKTFSAKLFDIGERYLRICITLTAAAGARLPVLSELAVFYPGRTLMEDLPAIYQRDEARPNSFLRSLVGVMETTTQGLDARIGAMGGQIHPSTAPEPWLDFIARWLGLPWDDGLNLEQKQAILKRAAELAIGRGTRAGLEALLESLISGAPRRFRVTDATADYGFAVVGGVSCPGSALPAMLGGRTRWSPELDFSAVLGFVRLPCAGQLDDGAWQLAGKVRIEVAATAAERTAWEPWLLSLLTEMVPLTARVELRWVPLQALRTNRLDGAMTLESAPAPHLGADAITSRARLPERGARLSASGTTIGARLR